MNINSLLGKESTKMIVVLVVVSLLAATSLSMVYEKTRPTIEENKRIELKNSLGEVFPLGDRFEENNELALISEGREGIKKMFDGYDKEDNKIGVVLLMDTIGFAGSIRMLVGVDNSKKITGMKILEHLETPGLGERITEDEFLNQFTGKPITLQIEDVDAITGATISSTAVIETITGNVGRISEYLVEDEVIGATPLGNESIIVMNKTIENASS